MVSATDGSAFTGSVTVAVTGDAGTQATGSVGSGACTHEGNGYHTYAPAQAETNYDLVAFTFTGTGAVPVTVQIFTNFPQTGDNYARLGAPAGASVSADVAAIKTQTAAIETDTSTDIPATLTTIAAYVDTEVAAIKAKTDNLPASPAAVGSAMTLTAAYDAAKTAAQAGDAMDATKINGDATAAANLAKTTRAIGRFTVSGVPSTTSIPTSACTPAGAVADQFKGRIITFDADTTTTALRGQSTDITASTNAATPTFTVTALTTAPAVGDTGSIT